MQRALSIKILSTVKTTCTTNPQQIAVMELEGYRWLSCSKQPWLVDCSVRPILHISDLVSTGEYNISVRESWPIPICPLICRCTATKISSRPNLAQSNNTSRRAVVNMAATWCKQSRHHKHPATTCKPVCLLKLRVAHPACWAVIGWHRRLHAGQHDIWRRVCGRSFV